MRVLWHAVPPTYGNSVGSCPAKQRRVFKSILYYSSSDNLI